MTLETFVIDVLMGVPASVGMIVAPILIARDDRRAEAKRARAEAAPQPLLGTVPHFVRITDERGKPIRSI